MSDPRQSRLRDPDRWALAGLVAAMAGSAALILWANRGTGFTSDELLYYGRLVELSDGFTTFHSAGVEYFLAPFSGHLQLVGKLIYEALFATVGIDHAVFRVVTVAGVVLCAGLVFALVRRRVGPLPALAAAVSLLFLGAAWEVMLWPFDLHTVLALAAGLGALLALDHGGRRGDVIACVLLVVSVATIEVGLAFTIGVAALVLRSPDRARRAWVFGVPLLLYTAWWAWARQYEQGEFAASEISSAPLSIGESLSATLGSLVGRIDAGTGVFPQTVGINGWGIALAVLATGALVWRMRRVGPSPWLTALGAALGAYWLMIALATPSRPPDSSRYMFASAALVILIAAEAARGVRFSRVALGVIALVVVIALPLNITKLFDGRTYQLSDSKAHRAHFAMIELAAAAEPAPAAVQRSGRDVIYGLEPASYLEAVPRLGSIAFNLDRLRAEDHRTRTIADQTLAALYELELEPAPAPAGGPCRRLRGDGGVAVDLSGGEALLRTDGEAAVGLGLGRFSSTQPSVPLEQLVPGEWRRLTIPADSAPDSWRLFASGGLRICEPGGSGV